MTCPLCNGTGYALIPAGAAPCTACDVGRKIGNRPKRRRKAPRASEAQRVASPKARWKQWNETLERMGAK